MEAVQRLLGPDLTCLERGRIFGGESIAFNVSVVTLKPTVASMPKTVPTARRGGPVNLRKDSF